MEEGFDEENLGIFYVPAWQAAQLAEKTCSPAPTSPANAGEAIRVVARAALMAAVFCEGWKGFEKAGLGGGEGR